MTDREKLEHLRNFCFAREHYFKEYTREESPHYKEDMARVDSFQLVRFIIEDMLEDEDGENSES